MNAVKSKAQKTTKKSAAGTAATGKSSKGFSDFEKAAMKERARELKMASSRAEGEKALLAKIAEMSEPDRSMAKRLHAIVTAAAPDLAPKTWYGMPAYTRDDKVICFFQAASKFNARYATFGFNDFSAKLDAGSMWPTSYALEELTKENEALLAALVTKAAS